MAKPTPSHKKTLVIVESPTKAKTIGGFLGSAYDVESSYGHIRDLPKSKIGIDVAHDFAPTYVIPPKAKDVIAALTKKAEGAAEVILATDEDREGEAISWHLAQALGLSNDDELRNGNGGSPIKRIVFHEITKSAIEDALAHPRGLDLNLVDAQQARRILDRLVGYELSPFLWRKVRYGLSAGRVQSVAVRLVVEREREIEAFEKREYWSIEAVFAKAKETRTIKAYLYAKGGVPLGKMGIRSEGDARGMMDDLGGAAYRVENVVTRDVTRMPAPPFTTSTLQQEAARKLGFSAKQTMTLAQRLYENGYITYMRTDSVALAKSALLEAQRVIAGEFGEAYALPAPRFYRATAKGAQEAHEAIRPTVLMKNAAALPASVEHGERRLYELIWKRTIACQMQPALLEQTAVDICATYKARDSKLYTFRAHGQVVTFDGFIRVYTESRDDAANGEEETGDVLPKIEKGEVVNPKEISPIQHFTEPPPRYTDATLVKALEAAGVGRPSTYAPTLSTIQDRGYVVKTEKRYAPTEIGIIVNDILVEHFPEIVDIGFTSHIEEELDGVAEGNVDWITVCREFYGPFKKHLDEKEVSVEKHTETSDVPCPHCGKPMIIKFGRMGKFMACPEPGSKVTLPMPEEAAKIRELEEKTKGEQCHLCGKPMAVRRGRFGFFLGCTDYPTCKGISKIWEKTGFTCPACLIGDIVLKKSRGRGKPFYACTRYPDCAFAMNKKPEREEDLKEALLAWKTRVAHDGTRTEGTPKKPKPRTKIQ